MLFCDHRKMRKKYNHTLIHKAKTALEDKVKKKIKTEYFVLWSSEEHQR